MGAMFRLAIACALFVIAACNATHDPNRVAVGSSDCYTCHKPDYDATEAWPTSTVYPIPIAHSSGCGTSCADCHDAPTAATPNGTGWVNNLGGCVHPEQTFPLQSNGTATRPATGPSPHANIKCRDCHSPLIAGTSAMGANTDCLSCHPNDAVIIQPPHDGYPGYTYVDSVRNFCLSCHPAGLADKHPEMIFPSTHQGAKCNHCHDMSISTTDYVANPNCMAAGCHVLSKIDTSHAGRGSYATDKTSPPSPLTTNDFCVNCHGLGHGGG
jgi:hypothetical protein